MQLRGAVAHLHLEVEEMLHQTVVNPRIGGFHQQELLAILRSGDKQFHRVGLKFQESVGLKFQEFVGDHPVARCKEEFVDAACRLLRFKAVEDLRKLEMLQRSVHQQAQIPQLLSHLICYLPVWRRTGRVIRKLFRVT